jgi:hypothetical protein
MPAVFLSGKTEIVLAKSPVTEIVIVAVEVGVSVTMSHGESSANPKMSNPGPRFAVVAGALTVTGFGNIKHQNPLTQCKLQRMKFYGTIKDAKVRDDSTITQSVRQLEIQHLMS